MRITELIHALEELRTEVGDLDVVVNVESVCRAPDPRPSRCCGFPIIELVDLVFRYAGGPDMGGEV